MGEYKKRLRRADPDRALTREVPDFAKPPASAEVEAQVLSAVMIDYTSQSWAICVQCGAKAKAFDSAANRTIWQTIEDLRARGSPCSLAEVHAELELTGELEEIGGMKYLLEVSGRVNAPLSVRFHAEQLVLLWQLRHTLKLTNDLRDSVLSFEGREEFAAKVGDIAQKFIRFGRRETVKTLPEQIESVKNDVLARAAGKEDRTHWVYTGLPTFDRRLQPLNSAKLDGLTIVAGASGHGKSAFMRQIGWNCLHTGGRMLVYTRETDIESFIEQMVSSVHDIDLLKIVEFGKLWPERLQAFADDCDRLMKDVANKRLWVVQHEPGTPLEYVEELEQHYRGHAHLYGHPDVVVVDYLQLFNTKRRCASREAEVAVVSGKFQALQRESGVAWVVGCQYNEKGIGEMRTVKRDKNEKIIHRLPCAGDLRESQKIYHDADRVIAFYRPPVDCRDQDNYGPNILKPEIWICQIKRRKGGTGVVKCWFEQCFTRFVELGRSEVIESEASASNGGTVPPGGADKAEWLKEQRKRQGGK